MPARPRALYISPSYSAHLPAFPAEVIAVNPPPGIFDLPAYLRERGQTCDLVIQDETLSPRVLVKGLWELSCPKAYWSLDPHLNHYWQGPYCSQFDLVACTQKAWLKPLEQAGAAQAKWLTWCEAIGPWRDHAERDFDVAFVGRITEHRPKRGMFARFLQARQQMHLVMDAPYHEVPLIYGRTRLAPNESLQGEITQRLFLAAAQGCLVLEQASDNGLEELYQPGQEVVLYHDPLELAELLAHYRRHPGQAEAMGRVAWERASQEHGPQHRLRDLGRMVFEAPVSAPTGHEGQRRFWLGAARCLESRLIPACASEVLAGLAQYPDDPQCLTAMLRLFCLGGQAQRAMTLAWDLARQGAWPGDAEFNLSGAGLALLLGQNALARWRLDRLNSATGVLRGEIPEDPTGLYALMAEIHARQGRLCRPGYLFDPTCCVPGVATECFSLALSLAPGDVALIRKSEAMLRGLPGSQWPRLGLLSEISLREADNFRVGLALGLANLEIFRVKEGLDELALARELAQAQGKVINFERMLAGADPSGRIRAALRVGQSEPW